MNQRYFLTPNHDGTGDAANWRTEGRIPFPQGGRVHRQKKRCWRAKPDAMTWRGLAGRGGRAGNPGCAREPHRLLFVDETGTTTKMVRLRGRTRRGQRLKARAPFGHWRTQTFIAGLRCDGLTAPWLIDRLMNRQIFETWVETELAPTLQPDDVVILDNLSSHESPTAAAVLKERGAWFLFLPPYSPDLNPIELAFGKLEAHLRRIGARTIDALWRAIGHICDLFSPDEC